MNRVSGRRSLAGMAFAAALVAGCTLPISDRSDPVATGGATQADDPAVTGAFSGWAVRHFPGKRHTAYRLERIDGRDTVRADADRSVSMFRRAVRVEASALGTIRFSWRVPRSIDGADLRNRQAEDSPVRLVLAFAGDTSRLPMRDRMMFELAQAVTGEAPPYATLMYVWDNQAPEDTLIPSNSTARIQKIVVDSGPTALGRWRDHERRIADDFRRAFGEEPGALVGIGVMTDTDNTGKRTRAWYGPVELRAAEAPTTSSTAREP
jgi:hypothetical protein